MGNSPDTSLDKVNMPRGGDNVGMNSPVFPSQFRIGMMKAFAGVAAAMQGEPDLSCYNWATYKQEHNLQFNGGVEASVKATFDGNMKVIREHNANAEKSFFMAPTKFTHLT